MVNCLDPQWDTLTRRRPGNTSRRPSPPSSRIRRGGRGWAVPGAGHGFTRTRSSASEVGLTTEAAQSAPPAPGSWTPPRSIKEQTKSFTARGVMAENLGLQASEGSFLSSPPYNQNNCSHILPISSSWTDETSSQVSKPTIDLKMFSTEDAKLACIR